MLIASRSARWALTPSALMHALNFLNTSRHITSKRLRVSSFSLAASLQATMAAFRAKPVFWITSSRDACRSSRKPRTNRIASASSASSSSSGLAGSVSPPSPSGCVPAKVASAFRRCLRIPQ